jgi:ABC-type branched-subunit amino acid transport system ATPase component
MAAFLKRLDPNLAILLIEHDMDVVFGVVDHISVLHFGKLVEQGTTAEVRRSAKVQEIYLGTG